MAVRTHIHYSCRDWNLKAGLYRIREMPNHANMTGVVRNTSGSIVTVARYQILACTHSSRKVEAEAEADISSLRVLVTLGKLVV